MSMSKQEAIMELEHARSEYKRMYNEKNAMARQIVQMKKDGKTVENSPELKSLNESWKELEREVVQRGMCIDLLEDYLEDL